MKLIILLDTNFILLPLIIGKNIKKQIDELIDYKYDFVILENQILELKKISSKYKNQPINDIEFLRKIWPKLELIKYCDLNKGTVDEKILKIAKERKYLVATNDMELRRKLKENSIPTIFLRQKRFVKIDAPESLKDYLK